MDHVGIEVRFEGLEVGPRPSPEELVLDVAEDLLRGAVVDAAALARHALRYLRLPQATRPCLVLVLPAHIAVQDRGLAFGHLRQEPVEQGHLLGNVRSPRRAPRDDLLAAEVVNRREVRLPPGLPELRDVGAHLPPRAVGGEVSPDDALIGVVAVVVGLASYAAPYPHLAHHLEGGLVGDDRAFLRPQAHGDPPMPAAVDRPGEDLGDAFPQLWPGRPLRTRQRVVVDQPGQAGAFQQVIEAMQPRERRPPRP